MSQIQHRVNAQYHPEYEFSLRTGYGDSANYTGGKSNNKEDPVKTQGMCQGNGAAPAAWTVTNIPMIATHKHKGHGAHFIAPIWDISGHIVGGLFVDDMDLVHVDMQVMETILEAHSWHQESVINWGRLLIATGGALKPSKCSFYLISFKWKADGTWVYKDNVIQPDFAIGVPLADDAEIEHLPVPSTVKTLESMMCPTGSSAATLGKMQQQGQEWVD